MPNRSAITAEGPHMPSESTAISFAPQMPPVSEDTIYNVDLDNIDCTSTYTALSYFIKEWKRAGGRNPTFIPKAVIAKLFHTLEQKQVDISSVDSVPYDAEDLHECLVLLARIQNKGAAQGGDERNFSILELVEDTLVDRKHKHHLYDIGEYVEVLGPSMIWRLEQIKNVLKTYDLDGETPIYIYETAVDHELKEDEIRWPKEALVRIFGYGPWIWQEWACLRLENKLSFCKGLNTDFEFFDISGYVKELWNVWFMDDRNQTFRDLFDRVGESGQEQLLRHIMAPFDLMEDVISNKDDRWDIEDAGVSIFTYVSLLGSGFLDGFVVFLLQLCMPIFLFSYYNSLNEDEKIAVGTREMLFAVLAYYLFKVSRDVWANFRRVVGISEEVYSKIQSLRKNVWDNGNDSFAQSLGFTFDQFMNTGYICYLYLFNMWILFNVTDPFEILGSVIFFEFLFDLDEELANSIWFDRGSRFLKAGLVGLILQQTVQQENSHTRDTYMEKVFKESSMTKSEMKGLMKRCEDAKIPDGPAFLGTNEPDETIQLLVMEERVTQLRSMDSKTSVKRIDETKPRVYFSGFFASDSPMFERHAKLRAWTQWEKLLFLFETPTLVPDDYEAGTKIVFDELDTRLTVLSEDRLWDALGVSRGRRFWRGVFDVLAFRGFRGRDFGPTRHWRTWRFFFTRLVHAFLSWTSHMIQLLFPFLTFAALIMVFLEDPRTGENVYCYLHQGDCEFERENYFQP
ncbi:unnamed protein product [Cylindrotheca closterium]|uniref:Uncharacterized protein n=1 Tax=Cylindrotheca closterium TaxID=2856 RepID=A0AAD2FYB4_9STRA|nr:unnamed protein product [Cylindrotheca closterium]